MYIVVLIGWVIVVFQIFGPAMAAILPLAAERRKLAWAFWIASLVGGFLVAVTSVKLLGAITNMPGALPRTLALWPAKTMTSELIVNWMPAGIALGFWRYFKPDKGTPVGFRYKLIVLAAVYIVPNVVAVLYLFLITKSVHA